MPSFLLPLSRYADFNGRSRRAEYWQFWAFQVVVGVVLGIIGAGSKNPLALISALFSLAMIIPNLAVAIRRFHDTNRTGWWVLFPSAVACLMTIVFFTVVGSNMSESLQDLDKDSAPNFADFGKVLAPMLALVIVPTILAATVTFVFHVLPGTEGPNRFGDDPKGGGIHIARVFDAPVHETEVDETPYKPVFDFGPIGTTQRREEPAAPQPVREAQPAPRPVTPPSFGAPARPSFGKRGL